MNEKKYQIKTIKELLDIVTPENIDCFLKDFGSWLAINVMAKTANKEMGNAIDISTSGVFTWIDDGKNDARITIQIKNN